MPQKRPKNPLKLILLTKLDNILEKVLWDIRFFGKIGLTNWSKIFNLIEEIDDIGLTYNSIYRILEHIHMIMDPYEKAFVESETILLLSSEKDILHPLYDYILEALDTIINLEKVGDKLYLLSKLYYATIKLDYPDLKKVVEERIKELLSYATPSELADYYSYVGYLMFEFDIGLSDRYLDEALDVVELIQEPEERIKLLSKIAYRYSKLAYNEDIEKTVNELFTRVLDELSGLFNRYSVFLEIAEMLFSINPDVVYDYLDAIYDDYSAIRDPFARGTGLLKLLKTAAKIGYSEMEDQIIRQLIDIVSSKGLSELNRYVLASELAKNTLNINKELSVYIGYTILDGVEQYITNSEQLSFMDMKVIAKIIRNLKELFPHKLEERIDSIVNYIIARENRLAKAINLILVFLYELSKEIPRKAKSILEKVKPLIFSVISMDGIYAIAEQVDKIVAIDENIGNEVIKKILTDIEETKAILRKLQLLATIVPRLQKTKYYKADILKEYLNELLENKKPIIKYNVYLKLAEGYSKYDQEEAKKYYSRALFEVEHLLSQNFNRGLRALRKTLYSVNKHIRDKVWIEQINQYYNTLELYLRFT